MDKNEHTSKKIEPVSEFFASLFFFNIGGRTKAWRLFLFLLIFLCIGAVFFVLDITPKVESDFFFSTDDPQLQNSKKISKLFPSRDQIILNIKAEGLFEEESIKTIRELSDTLGNIDGVKRVLSLTDGPPVPEDVKRSPLWRRLLLSHDEGSTNIILMLEKDYNDNISKYIEDIVSRYKTSDMSINISGAPYIIELIRRHLTHDLKVFSIASFVIFGIIIMLVFRSWNIMAGALVSCLISCSMTLGILNIINVPIGILTANIATIIFVLTLSHIVFLTSNWRKMAYIEGNNWASMKNMAVTETFAASFWCMMTTLLGFSSLLFVSAKPIRELGIAGAIGSGVSIAVAYGIYPLFMNNNANKNAGIKNKAKLNFDSFVKNNTPKAAGIITISVLIAIIGLFNLNKDPSLLSYFKKGSEIRNGLEAVDKNGGSAPFNVVVSDPGGQRLDTRDVYEKLSALQKRLEEGPDTGVVLSPSVIIDEAERNPISIFFSLEKLIDILSSPEYDQIALSFFTPDRKSGLFNIRMKESQDKIERFKIIDNINKQVLESGLKQELTGGFFQLEAELNKMVFNSILTGLLGLGCLFLIISLIIAGSFSSTMIMVACLIIIPVFTLGMLGHLRMPFDIIVSPAANVAIAIGIDSMIHLVMRAKRIQKTNNKLDFKKVWQQAQSELWRPITGATLIICSGFGIFCLSSFPPTQRFGAAVVMGTAFACLVALFVFPYGVLLKGEK